MADIRTKLLLGAAVSGIALLGVPLAAQESVVASQSTAQAASEAPVFEQQRYAMRLMMNIYNGERDFSHTQMLGVGRVREGDISFTQFDFGDGAVVLTDADGDLSASRFMNVSGTEKGILYDYSDKTMMGDPQIAGFHNMVVRPLLGQAPDLGSNVAWSADLTLDQVGIYSENNAGMRIALSREYFTHDGKPMVLIHYAIPAFSYVDGAGRSVVHWGQGISLTDPGFGMIYLNSMLHRSVASFGGDTTPYRFARTMVAANEDGSAMVDYRDVPQLAPYLDALFSAEAMRVVHDGERVLGFNPLATARNLDLIALSIAEDGGNEAPMASAAQFLDDRGNEVLDSAGAQAMTQGEGLIFGGTTPSEPGAQLSAQEMVQAQQSGAGLSGSDQDAFEQSVEQLAEELGQNSGGSGTGGSLQFREQLQRDFGGADGTNAFVGPNAQNAANSVGANAMTGSGTIFGTPTPSQPGNAMVAEETAHALSGGGQSQGNPGASEAAAEEAAADAVGNGITTRGGAGTGNGAGTSTEDLDARAMTGEGNPIFTNPSDSTLVGEEVVNTQAQGGQGSLGGSLADEVSPETLEMLNRNAEQGGGLQGNLSDLTNNETLLGNQEGDPPGTIYDPAVNAGDFINTVLGYTDKGNAITGGMLATQTVSLTQYANDLGQRLNQASNTYDQAMTRLKNSGKVTMELMPEAQLRLDNYLATVNEATAIEQKLDRLSQFLSDTTKAGGAIPPETMGEAAQLVEQYNILNESAELQYRQFNGMPTSERYMVTFDQSDSFTSRLLQNVEDAARDLVGLEDAAKSLEQEASLLRGLVQRIPTEKIGDALEYFGNSPAGKVLDGVSHGMNIYTTTTAINSTIDAAYNDKSSGQLNLTRDHSLKGVTLDLIGLAGNALSGNVAGFTSDAIAITTGSVSDVFLAAKALRDTNKLNNEILRQQRLLDRQLSEKRHKNVMSIETLLDEAGVEIGELEEAIEDVQNTSQERLRERAEAREQVRRQEEEQRRQQEAEERRRTQERLAREEENERRRTMNDRLREDMEPDYPTAPPRDPNTPRREREPEPTLAEQGYVTETEQERWLREVRAENAEAAEALKRYQEQKLANREETTIFDGDYEMRLSSLEVSELLVTAFDLDPVTFDPVTFDMPLFDEDGDLFVRNPDGTTSLKKVGPDDFKITPFDAPEISKFGPTDPDDVDGYPGTGQYPAFDFGGFSGSVNVDLSRFEEWLATQDIQKLIRLAIAAGYPYQPGDDGLATLAVALNSAEQIIRLSQDAGYRAWANRAPSCSGYVGCGPNYLGQWNQKRAIVALGDILADSREVFSTGGFSDIGISGFNLAYILRDFGIQDGDLIDVEIQQFGRTIATLEGHFLTTAGDAFSARLRPGVATMVVTALNEGSASPNTAEVTIENVVRGDGVQTYDLNTGETAVLRIEANATAE